MTFQMKLAGRSVEVQAKNSEVYSLCREYSCSGVEEPDIRVLVTSADIAREETKAVRTKQQGFRFAESYLETLAVYRKIAEAMLRFDTFLMHGTIISTQGQGYMITAPSGVGKSTRAKLWVEAVPGSFVVNGDKPLLWVAEDAVYAYGTPWCGKEGWNTDTAVPLRGIFFLERSDNENMVAEIPFAQAFPMMFRQTYRPEGTIEKRKTLQLLSSLAGKVKFYRFRSQPTEEAVRAAWEAAGK